MRGQRQKVRDDGPVDAQSYAKAILNILDDFGGERARLDETQRAVLNILEDAANEKSRLEAAQTAILNILDDSAEEKGRLGDTQRAVLNILDDFDIEKKKVEQINVELRSEIAERTRAEEALRQAKVAADAANRELEAFSYSVAHDLRAPLRAIDGFARILVEDHAPHLSDEAQRLLHLVRENTQQMGQLVDDLLEFSRLGRQLLKVQLVSPAEIVRQALADLRADQEGRRVKLSIGNLSACQADPALLKQVYVNLLSNALKFTRQREEAVIEVGNVPHAAAETSSAVHHAGMDEADQIKPSEGPVYFVRDNGVGFDMRYARKLFGVFQRLHRAEEYEGTGVGLAIVHRIIHRHGGRVWAHAEVDEGATFYFTLGGRPHGSGTGGNSAG